VTAHVAGRAALRCHASPRGQVVTGSLLGCGGLDNPSLGGLRRGTLHHLHFDPDSLALLNVRRGGTRPVGLWGRPVEPLREPLSGRLSFRLGLPPEHPSDDGA
jgi:hypothetical protein